MKKVCLDTNVVIWGLLKKATVGQEAMIRRAEALLQFLQQKKVSVIIPSVVLGESMVKLSEDERGSFLAKVSDRLFVAPFDQLSALHFARLFGFAAREASSGERRKIKADLLIAACAAANRVDVLFSNDDEMNKLVIPGLRIERIPSVPVQWPLFKDE